MDRIQLLEEQSSQPEFWNEMEKAQGILQKLKSYKELVDQYNRLCTSFEDVQTLIDMGIEENDAELAGEAKEEADTFVTQYESMRIATLLDGEYDTNNAILSLHAGAGGTEEIGRAHV